MKQWTETDFAACAVCAALSLDFVSGRAAAAFYGQMGRASWLGAAACAGLFGLGAGMLTAQGRKPAGILRQRGVKTGFAAASALAACMLVRQAGCMGALALPVEHAAVPAALAAVLAALAAAFAGGRTLARCGRVMLGLHILWPALLLLFGRLPADRPRWEVQLRLADHVPAALFFAAAHASAGLCAASGLLARAGAAGLSPRGTGLRAAVLMLLALCMSNAVLQLRGAQLTVLRLPFVALAAGWGKAGFAAAAGIIYLASTAGLACISAPAAARLKGPEMQGKDVKL